MGTHRIYRSFNENKYIEELQYKTQKSIQDIDNLKLELQFYKSLLNKPVFKPQTLNLYENLVKFMSEINEIDEISTVLQEELSSKGIQITNMAECEDVDYDDFYINHYNDLKQKIFNLENKTSYFKFKLFQYLDSTLID